MTHPVVEEFGRRLIQQVRNPTVADWQKILSGQVKSERASQISRQFDGLDSDAREFVQQIVPQVTETVLHYLLWWLEQDEDFQIVGEVAGQQVQHLAEESDGFPGELYTGNGWIARYSDEGRA